MPGDADSEGYSWYKTGANGGDAVSKSMLKSIRKLYNTSKASNSTTGDFGFQLSTKPAPMKKVESIKATSVSK